MALKKDASTPKKGMNRDKAIFDLDKVEYSFALNANFHDEHGSGQLNLQNEPSNIYCSGFKAGYKVIGHKFDLNADRTYFFLVNPDTGCSEIGYIDSLYSIDGLEQVEQECDCKISVVLETPLEGQVQTAVCAYNTIISDYCTLIEPPGCTGCLNFSIDYPIYESNVHIKDEKTGKVIYWTDNYNPQRYLQLDRLEIYTQDVDPCTGDVANTCLQCDKLRIFKLFDKPCIDVRVIQNGGNLRGGMYEVLVAYSTGTGDELSDYYAITNPIPIHDKNNNILDQTNLDYLTNFSIGLNISDLDQEYEYYKVAVIYRSGLDASVTVKNYGVYPINNEKVSISTLVDKGLNMDLLDVLSRKPFYTKARGFASGNGYLFQYGMESHREVNLQPIVNLLGSLVKWSTVVADEDVYHNGAHVSNYLSYMRDEVTPLSIKFFMDGGYETPNFVFIPRPPTAEEVEVLDSIEFPANKNTNSILDNGDNCYENLRDKRWQFENTATIIDRCLVPAGSGLEEEVVPRTITSSCFVEDGGGALEVVDEIVGPDTAPIGGEIDLVSYINQNIAAIIASTDPDWASIVAILSGSYPSFTCDAEFDDNCGLTPTLISEEIVALSVDSEEVTVGSIPYSEYKRPSPPIQCLSIADEGAGPIQATTFMTAYMRAGEIVYERTAPMSNTSCGYAMPAIPWTDPQIDNGFYMQYAGSLESVGGIGTLQQGSITVTAVNTAQGYTANLHTNAQWFKIDFSGADSIILELTPPNAGTTDDVCQDTMRVSLFDSCTAVTDIATYGVIINDINLANDPQKFFVLNAADFGGTSSTAYIAIDSPIITDVSFDIDLTGTSGTADIVIDGSTYTATYGGSLATTATDFVTSHAATLLATQDIIVTAGGDTLTFRSLDYQYLATTITNITGDLDGSISVVEKYHVLSPPCGCTNVFSRVVETTSWVTYEGLKFGKKMTYSVECNFTIPVLNGCDPTPWEYGKFSYWESVDTYPCNNELYDSSAILIKPTDLDTYLTAAEKTEFLDYYVQGGSTSPVLDAGGNYVLVNTDFRDQPIRHYKFPCNTLVPFMSTSEQAPASFGNSVVYPIGFSISNESIKTFLDIAVNNGLLSIEERARINKYEIFRGDRSVDKSVIAKGLLFDMYTYPEDGEVIWYPNYPLNSLGKDQLNGGIHPSGSASHRHWTFHSPDTSFYKPTLPREVKVEGYQFGASGTYFDIVRDHPTYALLGDKAYNLATGLAAAEVGLEIALKSAEVLLQAMASGTVPGIALSVVVAILIVAILVGGLFKIGQVRYQWLETFRNLGHPYQFAYYSATIGHYSFFVPNPLSEEVLRGTPSIHYMNDGRHSIPNEFSGDSFNVNNMDREDSVFLTIGDSHSVLYPSIYSNWDNVDTNPNLSSRRKYSGVGGSGKLIGNAASPYVALKQYLPGQYGSISSVKWVHTGFCGDLGSSLVCDPIFGGDTYISRFSVKRKLPFFTTNSHGLAPLTPFKYSDYFNINPEFEVNKFFIDYLIQDNSDNYFMMYIFPTNRSHYQLDEDAGTDFFYITPPAKFYLFSYGFPYFLVESVINSGFRYAKRELHENFYPNFGNVIEFTQESNVTIHESEKFYYNFVYSTLPTTYPWRMLPVDYNEELYSGLNNLENTVIYSKQDNSENSLSDPWLLYRGLDSYGFPTSFGKLIDMDSIESEQIFTRFENGITIFGAIDQIRDRVTPDTKNIGNGGIFAGRSVNFNKTDLGYAGTQHKAKVSCEFGHFWVDAKRGQVFNLQPNAKGLVEITKGVEKWFKENLPFKISQSIPGISQEVLDNNFKGLGITMGWDSRLKRIFLTKLDYKPIVDIEHVGTNFYFRNIGGELEQVELTDTTYFEDCSFTIAYSPLTDSWVSYYSFKPNYYIAFDNYFQTGVNYSVDASEIGLWSHLPFLSSYQVFYGKLYPFIIEDSTATKMTNSLLHSIEYWMDVRKYYNKYDYADIYGKGFNKAFIYNTQNNSGQLNLVHQKDNDLSQSINYPKHNTTSIDILQSEIHGKWAFNYFYNLIKNEKSGLPIWLYDCNQINKVLNNKLLDYRSNFKDRMRGDYFILRLQQDIESRYKMIYRFNTDTRDYYEQ